MNELNNLWEIQLTTAGDEHLAGPQRWRRNVRVMVVCETLELAIVTAKREYSNDPVITQAFKKSDKVIVLGETT